MKAKDLYSLPDSLSVFSDFFSAEAAPWEWLSQIKKAFAGFDFASQESKSDLPVGAVVEGDVYIHPDAKVVGACHIIGPAWIGAGCEIRPGAFVRGNVIVGEGCVVGNSCEFKNCLLMDNVQVPHFSYVGDSILGSGSHLGAGVIVSNLRLDQKPVPVIVDGEKVDTGLRKVGALIGENAEAGSNSVLNPGTILMKRALVFPLSSFIGTLDEGMIASQKSRTTTFPRRD